VGIYYLIYIIQGKGKFQGNANGRYRSGRGICMQKPTSAGESTINKKCLDMTSYAISYDGFTSIFGV